MLAAICDIQTSTGATRLATTLDLEHHPELSRVDQPDRASMIAGAAARSYSLTARRAGGDGLRALTAIARRCQGTRAQPDRSEPHPLNRASRTLRRNSRTRADALHNTRDKPTAPGHSRHAMCRITPPEVTRC
jgi:hypothetical protein